MKLIASLLVLTAIWPVSYSTAIEKHDAISDVCGVGYATINGGTTGGSGAAVVTVTTLAALTAAVAGTAKKIVVISGTIVGNKVVNVGSNTSLVGARGSALVGVGLRIFSTNNVIIRNVKVYKVLALAGDAINVQASSQVCLDHLDLSSDRDHDGDFYGSLLSITHGSTGITVSSSKFSNHWKACLVGNSATNGAEDSKITVTFAYNYWTNLDSAISPFRFGFGHIFNNVFENVSDGINPSDGAQLLVENNVGTGMNRGIYPTNGGGNIFDAPITAPVGTFFIPPYPYTLIPTSLVRSTVVPKAGQAL